jgi:hypothetical protein
MNATEELLERFFREQGIRTVSAHGEIFVGGVELVKTERAIEIPVIDPDVRVINLSVLARRLKGSAT